MWLSSCFQTWPAAGKYFFLPYSSFFRLVPWQKIWSKALIRFILRHRIPIVWNWLGALTISNRSNPQTVFPHTAFVPCVLSSNLAYPTLFNARSADLQSPEGGAGSALSC